MARLDRSHPSHARAARRRAAAGRGPAGRAGDQRRDPRDHPRPVERRADRRHWCARSRAPRRRRSSAAEPRWRSPTARRAERCRSSSRPGRRASRAVVRAGRRPGRGRPRRGGSRRRRAAEIERLLRLLVEAGASDLHLRTGEPPLLRHHGELVREQSAADPGRAAGDDAAEHHVAPGDRRVPRGRRHRLGLRDRGPRPLPLQRRPRPPRPDGRVPGHSRRPCGPPTRWA